MIWSTNREALNRLVMLLIVLCPLYFFWAGPVLYPLRLLMVFFHEASHAIATILTGGQMREFVVNTDLSGHIIRNGGSSFLIGNAGYVGAFLWGSLLGTFATLWYSRAM